MSRCVVVFARGPAEEKAKGFGGPGQRAWRLHRLLLERVLRTAAALPGVDIRWVTTGDREAAERFAARCVPGHRVRVSLQTGASAAERLERAVEEAFLDGATRVVAIGADAPELTHAH